MIKLFGWLSISEIYGNEDSYSPEALEGVMNEVRAIISHSQSGIELKYMNGTPFLSTAHASNHRTKEVDAIIETYKSVAKAATGSYGVIYLRDDEDNAHCNEFQKFVFKKGCCTVQKDTDFSPCIPAIEDEVE